MPQRYSPNHGKEQEIAFVNYSFSGKKHYVYKEIIIAV